MPEDFKSLTSLLGPELTTCPILMVTPFVEIIQFFLDEKLKINMPPRKPQRIIKSAFN